MKNNRILTGAFTLALLAILSGCQNNQAPTTSETATTSQTTVTSNSPSQEVTANKLDIGQDISVSLEDVLTLYQETYPNSHLTSIELEPEHNQYVYKLEGVDAQQEYELTVSATTKEIKKQKTEALDRDEQNGVKQKNASVDLANLATLNDVTETAKKETTDYTPVEWELKQELGITYWKVKLINARQEKEVKINAHDLSILEIKNDD